MFKIFDKWKIKHLDRKIDRLLLKSDDKIGRMFRHDKLKHNLLTILLLFAFLPALIFLILLATTDSIESSKTNGKIRLTKNLPLSQF